MVTAADFAGRESTPSLEPNGSGLAALFCGWRADAIALVVCLALGAISVLWLPSLPGSDVFSWLVWGREIAHHVISPHLALIVENGPSWKPLPVVFTTLFGPFKAAMKLWVAFDRGIGLLGIYAAYRLADRLGTSERWRPAGPIAGALAALAIVLTAHWMHDMFRATSEPMVITTALLCAEWHFAGRRMAAFWCGVALCLMRPEASVFLLAYVLRELWRRRGVFGGAVLLVGLVVIPVGWVLPPGLAGGHPLQASAHARAYAHGHAMTAGTSLFLGVFRSAVGLTEWPVLVAALALTVVALRARERAVASLAGISLGYVTVVAAMTVVGYPGLQRFMLPAAALVCVLAGVAVVRLATRLGGGMPGLALVSVAVAVAAPTFAGPIAVARAQTRLTRTAVRYYDDLTVIARRVGGVSRILPCGTSYALVNHTAQTGFAWALGVPLTRVRGVTTRVTRAQRPALAFFAHNNVAVGGAPAKLAHGLRGRPIVRYRMWRVVRVTRPGDVRVNRCVGS